MKLTGQAGSRPELIRGLKHSQLQGSSPAALLRELAMLQGFKPEANSLRRTAGDSTVNAIRNCAPPLGPPQGPRHRATVGSYGGVGLMSEAPLYHCLCRIRQVENDGASSHSRLEMYSTVT